VLIVSIETKKRIKRGEPLNILLVCYLKVCLRVFSAFPINKKEETTDRNQRNK
jgi:hypothetical protein